MREIRISERIRVELDHGRTRGCWEPKSGWIVVQRSTLSDLAQFAAVLLHEVAHAVSGQADVSREFEEKLTEFLGQVARHALLGPRGARPD